MAAGVGVLEASSDVPSVEGSGDEIEVDEARRPRRFGPVGIVALVGLLVIGAVFAVRGVPVYRRNHLEGTTRSVRLEWSCWNAIRWDQPGSSWHWDGNASSGPASRRIVTSSTDYPDGRLPLRIAEGRMHFDSSTTATFTSETGATMRFHRMPDGTFYKLGCAIDS